MNRHNRKSPSWLGYHDRATWANWRESGCQRFVTLRKESACCAIRASFDPTLTPDVAWKRLARVITARIQIL